jgi:hypothetical protein
MDHVEHSDTEFLRNIEDRVFGIGDDINPSLWNRLRRLDQAGLIRLVRARACARLCHAVLTGDGHRFIRMGVQLAAWASPLRSAGRAASIDRPQCVGAESVA